MILTPYDELPVHQAPYPVSYVPSTDYNWDEGYYVGAFSPDEKIFLAMGLRINPNTDMIGGYAVINDNGEHYTVRFSRCWRNHFDLEVGPFRYEVTDALRQLHITLAPNESALSFDIVWTGVSPAFLEEHHIAANRGRRTTDQTRYSQPGKVEGVVRYKDKLFKLDPQTWSGARDHSWGLYVERAPLSPDPKFLPPRALVGKKRAMRFWTCFRTEPYSGFFHLHEAADGQTTGMSDLFSTPFGGRIYRGWNGDPIELSSVRHEMKFQTGTRILRSATMTMLDSTGGEWVIEFESAAPPWVPVTIGYTTGSWKDGGTFHSYHGSERLALEWDEFDFSKQPAKYVPYGGSVSDPFGLGYEAGLVHGVEYLTRVNTRAPDGSESSGAAQIEHFINGRYDPYGFT